MPTWSTIITRTGRRLEPGWFTHSVLTSLLAGWLSGAPGIAASADQPLELSEGQVHAAQVKARTTVCEEEAPAVAAQMEPAYLEWLNRNPVIAQEALHALHFSPDAEARRAAYEALRQRLEKELRRELEAHPEAFVEECGAFLNDLTSGALDYP